MRKQISTAKRNIALINNHFFAHNLFQYKRIKAIGIFLTPIAFIRFEYEETPNNSEYPNAPSDFLSDKTKILDNTGCVVEYFFAIYVQKYAGKHVFKAEDVNCVVSP